jgi:hypothetical protein
MKYLGNAIALLLLAAVVFWLVQFKQTQSYGSFRFRLQEITQIAKNFVAVKKNNITMDMNPPRKAPITFIQIESELTGWMPQVFEKFTQADWDYFWQLVYEPIAVKEGRFKVKRYRNRAEIESMLRYRYSALTYLNAATWNELWGVAKVSWPNASE